MIILCDFILWIGQTRNVLQTRVLNSETFKLTHARVYVYKPRQNYIGIGIPHGPAVVLDFTTLHSRWSQARSVG